MNSTGLIIFARLDSSRLPKKTLKKIGTKTLLEHVIDRAKLVSSKYPIIVATSNREIDDDIVKAAKKNKVFSYRGSYKDVAKRALECCEFFKLDRFVRICGDRPFHLPCLTKLLVQKHKEKNLDLATNYMKKTYPSGVICEVISKRAMNKVIELTKNHYQREHITDFFYQNKRFFKIFNLESFRKDISNFRFSIDTSEDLEKANWFVKKFNGNISKATLDDLIKLEKDYGKRK